MIAPTPVIVVRPEVVIPKQCRLLGATVKGVGLLTAVSVQNVWRWGLIEDASGFEHHVFLSDLKRDQLIMPTEQMPYTEVKRRIGFGLWEEAYQLELVEVSDLTHVTDFEAA